jgi:sugar/nucleoside kinase (ribokinase family)/DNA-binding XRE family transcriptional regulator
LFEMPREFVHMTPGQVLKALRERRGLTQEALALSIGYTRRQIARWENDHYFPGPPALRDLCTFHDIQPGILNQARSGMIQKRSSQSHGNAFNVLCDRLARNHSKCDVVTLTCHNVDWIYRVDNIEPDYETTIEVEKKSAGGSGANTVSTLARLGLSVASLGVVGNDDNGRFLIAQLDAANVNTSDVVASADPTHNTGFTNIYADGRGRRTIYHFHSVNYHFAEFYQDGKLDKRFGESVSRSKILHISSFPTQSAMDVQRQLIERLEGDQILSFNPGAFQSKFGLKRLDGILRRTNLLFAYDGQLRRMVADSGLHDTHVTTEDLISRFLEWRVTNGHAEPFILVLKNNPELVRSKARREYITAASTWNGRYELARTDHLQLPAKYATCVDATGAGDNCAAGIIYGLFRLGSLEETVDLAFGLALRASSEMGARPELQADDVMSLRYLR